MSVKHFYLIGVAAIVGCAAPAGKSEMGGTSAPRKANILTADEIASAEADATNIYDALLRLRPIWLTPRGPNSFYGQGTDLPTLFIDGQQYYDVATLRTIQSNQVADVRYYRPDEAGGVFGIRAGSAGAIEIRLKQAIHPPVP